MEFDLRDLTPADVIWKRGRLIYVLAILLAFGAEAGAFAWSSRPALTWSRLGTADAHLDLLLMGAMTLGVGVAVAGIPRLLPGAEALSIDDRGLVLTYRGGTEEKFSWSDRCGFVLPRYTTPPGVLPPEERYDFCGPQFWRRRTLLPRNALEIILAEARQRPVQVSESRTGVLGRPLRSITYRIRFTR